MAKHSWETLSLERTFCRKCGLLKIHNQMYGRHAIAYKRTSETWRTMPPCDEKWPEGWEPAVGPRDK